MNAFDEILTAYRKQVELPWASDTPPAGRVWIIWYDKTLQRRFTGQIEALKQATLTAGHGWRYINLSPQFGKWIAKHEFFENLVAQPKELRGLLPDFEEVIISAIKNELKNCSKNDVLTIDGCGSLFGLVRVSTLISKISDEIPGRLLIGFPGKHTMGVYRLLDARDGWNYHAIPIPPDNVL